MKSLTASKCSRVMSGVFVACLAFAAHGSANVFDDAVFWFRGGKDKNGDGYIQQGEFFDDLHANSNDHANHNMSMSTSYYVVSGKNDYTVFKTNAVFRNERVVFPALGTGVEKEMQVLHISNVAKSGYYFPFVVNPRGVFANNNISNEYTVVGRIRLDDGSSRNECFLKVGYNTNNLARQGMWLGFTKPTSWYAGCKRIGGYRTANSESNDGSFQLNLPVPTNTWVDIAVVVGNGKLRVGVAAPVSLSSHNNNPTIAFDETSMWTDNCPLPAGDYYRMFCLDGQSKPKDVASADTTSFVGSVQQLAIWGRALSDQEVMAAFGMPRPAIFRTGFDNGNSDEFASTRSGETQTIDGLGSWQNVTDTMHAGDEWTVNFDVLRDEAGLSQIFSLRSLPTSAPADIEVALNGTSLGTRRVQGDARVFWPAAANFVVEGGNTLTVRRMDSDAGSFRMDAMEFGGSLGVGTGSLSATNDGRVDPGLNPTGIPSAADPNPQHWPQGLRPKTGVTNLHFRVWVDPDVVGVCSSKFKTVVSCEAEGQNVPSDEKFSFCVNGVEMEERGTNTEWVAINRNFAPGELLPGWNDIELKTAPNTTKCRWPIAYYRFETVLRRGFSLPPPGMSLLLR